MTYRCMFEGSFLLFLFNVQLKFKDMINNCCIGSIFYVDVNKVE